MQKDYSTYKQTQFDLTPLYGQRFLAAREAEIRIIRKAARLIKKPLAVSKILDVGCGCGEFVEWAVSDGCFHDATGIDQSLDNFNKAKRLVGRFARSRTEILYADIQSFLPPRMLRRFDIAIALGSLEHNECGMSRSLRNIHSMLRPEGVVVVTVPYQSIRHILLNRVSSSLKGLSPDEIFSRVFYQWRFTKAEIKREVALVGFDVFPFFKRTGRIHKAISVCVDAVAPKFLTAHMVYVIARKKKVLA
jgi:SAM-dependent methyltransferase